MEGGKRSSDGFIVRDFIAEVLEPQVFFTELSRRSVYRGCTEVKRRRDGGETEIKIYSGFRILWSRLDGGFSERGLTQVGRRFPDLCQKLSACYVRPKIRSTLHFTACPPRGQYFVRF